MEHKLEEARLKADTECKALHPKAQVALLPAVSAKERTFGVLAPGMDPAAAICFHLDEINEMSVDEIAKIIMDTVGAQLKKATR